MSTALDRADDCYVSFGIGSGGDQSNCREFSRTLAKDDIATLNAVHAVDDTVHAADHVIDAAEQLVRVARRADPLAVMVESPALLARMAPDFWAEPGADALGDRHPLRLGRLALFACAAVITLSMVADELPLRNVTGLSGFMPSPARYSSAPDPVTVAPPPTDRWSPASREVAVEPEPSAPHAALRPDAWQQSGDGAAPVTGRLATQTAPAASDPPAAALATSEAIRREAPHTVARQPDLDEIALLCKRGGELVAVGDIAAARLLLRRAAEAGDARSALMLARTYDPLMLEKLGAYGLAPDVGTARQWYQRATDLGAAEAPERLHKLAQRER